MPAAKLTHEQTQAVMRWHAAGEGRRVIARRLAEELGVSITDRAVGLIIARSTSPHVDDAPAEPVEAAPDDAILSALLAKLRAVYREHLSASDRVRVSSEIRALLADRRKARVAATRPNATQAQIDSAAVLAKIRRLTANARRAAADDEQEPESPARGTA